MAFRLLLSFLILNFRPFQVVFASVSCIGEKGYPVDWFIVLKLPRLDHSLHPHVVAGLGYIYLDSSLNQFTMPDNTINNSSSSVGQTLQQIYASYKRSDEMAYLMYDDKDPEGKESLSKGHTKGDLAFDDTSGFWLIHSVPSFPPLVKDGFNYPESGERYGQSFLCVTFQLSTFNDIGLQLLYNEPAIYDSYLPDSLASDVPNIKKAIDGMHESGKPYSHVINITSLKNVVYTSFAKSKYFEADLYHELVAPFYNADFLAETWQNGEGKLTSNCSRPTVENVKDLKLIDDPFKETHDHSKWTISKSADVSVVCVGDINRMVSTVANWLIASLL